MPAAQGDPAASSTVVPTPLPGRAAAERWVADHLAGLFFEPTVVSSDRFRGGQGAADAALGDFDVTGYARRRNEAYPEPRRGASRLSPYIRHGLLSLSQVWDAVGHGLSQDRKKFRDELLWQEYARHWYARLGDATGAALRRRFTPPLEAVGSSPDPAAWVATTSGCRNE